MEMQATYLMYPRTRQNWPPGELYDLTEDPLEFTSLYDKTGYEKIVKELTTRLRHWMESVDDPQAAGPPPDPWYEDAMDDFKSHITHTKNQR